MLHTFWPLCFGGRTDLPDSNDPATPPAAASDGLRAVDYPVGDQLPRI